MSEPMTSIKKVGRIAALTGVLSCCPACLFLRTVSHADTARELAAEGKYQEAIASYERHIESTKSTPHSSATVFANSPTGIATKETTKKRFTYSKPIAPSMK